MLCISPVTPSSKFSAWIPSAHSSVIAFASASTQLNDFVACVTLQSLLEYSTIFSAQPEVQRLVFGQPAQLLCTTTLNVFSFCVDIRKLSAHLGVPLRYRASPLIFVGSPPLGFEASRITSFVENVVSYLISVKNWQSPADERRSRPVMRVQLFDPDAAAVVDASLLPGVTTAFAWSIATLAQHRAHVTLVERWVPSQIVRSKCSLEKVSLSLIIVRTCNDVRGFFYKESSIGQCFFMPLVFRRMAQGSLQSVIPGHWQHVLFFRTPKVVAPASAPLFTDRIGRVASVTLKFTRISLPSAAH